MLVDQEDWAANYLAPILIYEFKEFMYNVNTNRIEKVSSWESEKWERNKYESCCF